MSCPDVPIGRFYNVNKSCQVIVGKPVGAHTLTVPNFGNSAVFVEVVSGVTTQNSLRGVGVESRSSFCNKPMV